MTSQIGLLLLGGSVPTKAMPYNFNKQNFDLKVISMIKILTNRSKDKTVKRFEFAKSPRYGPSETLYEKRVVRVEQLI